MFPIGYDNNFPPTELAPALVNQQRSCSVTAPMVVDVLYNTLKVALKAYRRSNWFFWFILKVANIRCFMLIAVEFFRYIMRK
jgi:hypothetical protein